SSWPASATGGSFKTCASWQGFWDWFPASALRERKPIGERSPIVETARLRSKLIQASWSAIRQDGERREFFRSVCRRHPRGVGARVAIVAVARKLSTRISVVLMQQRPYVVRQKIHSAPLTQEETSPQGTTR